jgi:EAL domain-containing protein (putative c-di-GMP-specific phosphodiesterase class I)
MAIGRCAIWRANGLPRNVSVNLSARDLVDDSLPDDVAGMLRRHGLEISALTLEITESAMMQDPARAERILGELRRMGCHIAVDDFGTGHASLAYLKRLPVTELKVDRSFVTDLETDEADRSIVRSTIELAHELGLSAVAEGVESEHVWNWLADRGFDRAQGRVLGMPMPAEVLEAMARKPEAVARRLAMAAGGASTADHGESPGT